MQWPPPRAMSAIVECKERMKQKKKYCASTFSHLKWNVYRQPAVWTCSVDSKMYRARIQIPSASPIAKGKQTMLAFVSYLEIEYYCVCLLCVVCLYFIFFFHLFIHFVARVVCKLRSCVRPTHERARAAQILCGAEIIWICWRRTTKVHSNSSSIGAV